MLNPMERRHNTRFKAVDIKDPSDNFIQWLSDTVLPSSGYISKSLRKKRLTDSTMDNLEYIGWSCKSCPTLLKRQAKYLYYIRLYSNPELYDITDIEIDILWKEETNV